MRMEPPVSVPSAPGTRPAAVAAPLPPLDPPQIRSASHGLCAGPKCGLVVVAPHANSCVFSLPTITAPARRSRATDVASDSGHVVRQDPGRGGRRRAGDVDHVLDSDRDAVQGPAFRQTFELGRLGQGLLGDGRVRKELSAPSIRSIRARLSATASLRRQLAGPQPLGEP